MTAALQIEDLGVNFGGLSAVDGITLRHDNAGLRDHRQRVQLVLQVEVGGRESQLAAEGVAVDHQPEHAR